LPERSAPADDAQRDDRIHIPITTGDKRNAALPDSSAGSASRLHRPGDRHAGVLVHAQDYPTKPITIVVPFPPGGTTDLVTRTLAESLSKSMGQPVLVENRPGAGTTVGADFVAKSRPDGYTLLMGAVHHTIAPSVYKKLSYDLQKDLVPVTTVASVPNIVAVNPAVTPVKTIAELIALAKSVGEDAAQLRLERQRHRAAPDRHAVPAADRARPCCTCRTRAARRSSPTCLAGRSTCRLTASRRNGRS
jgi:hypothetical protein